MIKNFVEVWVRDDHTFFFIFYTFLGFLKDPLNQTHHIQDHTIICNHRILSHYYNRATSPYPNYGDIINGYDNNKHDDRTRSLYVKALAAILLAMNEF